MIPVPQLIQVCVAAIINLLKRVIEYITNSNIHSSNVVMKGSTITFQLGDIPRTMFYQFSLRYKPQVSKAYHDDN